MGNVKKKFNMPDSALNGVFLRLKGFQAAKPDGIGTKQAIQTCYKIAQRKMARFCSLTPLVAVKEKCSIRRRGDWPKQRLNRERRLVYCPKLKLKPESDRVSPLLVVVLSDEATP